MRTSFGLIRATLFTIALALALGGAASAAQIVFHGATRAAVQVDDRSRSVQNDDGEDRDGEDKDDESGDKGDKKDEQGQMGQDEQDGPQDQSGKDEQGQHGQEGGFEGEHED